MTLEAMMSIWETISLISNYWIQLSEENFGEQFHLSQIKKKKIVPFLQSQEFQLRRRMNIHGKKIATTDTCGMSISRVKEVMPVNGKHCITEL